MGPGCAICAAAARASRDVTGGCLAAGWKTRESDFTNVEAWDSGGKGAALVGFPYALPLRLPHPRALAAQGAAEAKAAAGLPSPVFAGWASVTRKY